MDSKTLNDMAGRRVNITHLARRIGVSRQAIYDGFNRGHFRPETARRIAYELRIRDPIKRAQLVGL